MSLLSPKHMFYYQGTECASISGKEKAIVKRAKATIKKIKKNQKESNKTNSIAGNMARDAQKFLLDNLTNQVELKILLKGLIVHYKIKSQLQALDYLLIFFLFARDIKRQISREKFTLLLSHIIEKIKVKSSKSQDQESRTRFIYYQEHVAKYMYEKLSFGDFGCMLLDIKKFYGQIVLRRKQHVQSSLEKIKKFKDELHPEADPEADKTRFQAISSQLDIQIQSYFAF